MTEPLTATGNGPHGIAVNGAVNHPLTCAAWGRGDPPGAAGRDCMADVRPPVIFSSVREMYVR